ncbi:uncharacterized protein KZ484_015146 [Pholidichthys leucotaenia]
MDHGTPDFVPSVFPSQTPKKKVKWVYGRRKRRRRKANVKMEDKTTSLAVENPVDVQPSDLMETESELPEEMQTLSVSSMTEEGDTLNKEADTEAETNTVHLQPNSPPQPCNTLPDPVKSDQRVVIGVKGAISPSLICLSW